VDKFFEISGKKTYQAKAVILAIGLVRRKLGVPGEKEFAKKGVAYCSTCDAPLFAGKDVIVVGGGNSGVAGAVQLSNVAKKVYLIEMQPALLADEARQKDLAKTKTQIILGNSILEISGKDFVESVKLEKPFEGNKEIKVEGVFVEIGSVPRTELVSKLGMNVDNKGFIQVDAKAKTNISGIFAAGDATTGSNYFQQTLTAAAEGAIAAHSCFKYLKGG
jgi:thioredoxin reductase (NADPH)